MDLGGMILNGHRVFRDHTGYLTEYEGATYDNPHTLAFLDAKHDGGFYGDITGRLGYTWNNVLLYAKGGFAFLNADLRLRERFYDTKHDFDITDAVIGGWYDFFRN
ncbi:MAG: hypothetical protein HY765_05595, partial [Rhodomicrobium sp.]|nr:hypothetical protein [Rhodomicrobium sp.]